MKIIKLEGTYPVNEIGKYFYPQVEVAIFPCPYCGGELSHGLDVDYPQSEMKESYDCWHCYKEITLHIKINMKVNFEIEAKRAKSIW